MGSPHILYHVNFYYINFNYIIDNPYKESSHYIPFDPPGLPFPLVSRSLLC